MSEDEELGVSELGTKEYWDSHYQKEITNFKNHGDVGEIWFGEDIVDRIINWMENHHPVKKSDRIVDIGCGNGMLLLELSKIGYENLLGVDYSQAAINLAKEIARKYDSNIKFSVHNILTEKFQSSKFRVVFDKGTYDAISLSSNAHEDRKNYINSVFNCLEENGLLVLTSCNWTESELNEHFNEKFICYDNIPTPQFKFCGKVGSVVTCIVYKRKSIQK